MTVSNVAKLLKLSRNYVAAMAREGRLVGVHMGGAGKWRFTPASVRRFAGLE